MAIVPACRRIDLERLRHCLGRDVELATEPELHAVFADCERGALPAVGSAYRIPSVYDESLSGLSDVYFEAGDHEDVVHMDGAAFEELLAGAEHGRFTRAL
jgi:Ala-tRNA(Pro) deacylase